MRLLPQSLGSLLLSVALAAAPLVPDKNTLQMTVLVSLSHLTDAATEARSALVALAFSEKGGSAKLASAADKLAEAELALAVGGAKVVGEFQTKYGNVSTEQRKGLSALLTPPFAVPATISAYIDIPPELMSQVLKLSPEERAKQVKPAWSQNVALKIGAPIHFAQTTGTKTTVIDILQVSEGAHPGSLDLAIRTSFTDSASPRAVRSGGSPPARNSNNLITLERKSPPLVISHLTSQFFGAAGDYSVSVYWVIENLSSEPKSQE